MFFYLYTHSLYHQRVAFVYKAKREVQGSKVRVIWGYVGLPCKRACIDLTSFSRVTRPHGNSGVVKSKFRSNLPPRAFGASVRIVRVFCCIRLGGWAHLSSRCFTRRIFDHVNPLRSNILLASKGYVLSAYDEPLSSMQGGGRPRKC
jgi:hypothetical protein